MYHSISECAGPTNISPRIFDMQIDALVASGLPVVDMDTAVEGIWNGGALPPRAVAITFDDGFQDFADHAWPKLKSHGLPAINFLPTNYIGGFDDWEGLKKPRQIMDVKTIRRLADEGAKFGSHTVTHPRLGDCSKDKVIEELSRSKEFLEREVGVAVRHFAPPYGSYGPTSRELIAEIYDSAVSVELASATIGDNVYALPRIEMFYYQNENRWAEFLAGRGRSYLMIKRTMRKLRALVAT